MLDYSFYSMFLFSLFHYFIYPTRFLFDHKKFGGVYVLCMFYLLLSSAAYEMEFVDSGTVYACMSVTVSIFVLRFTKYDMMENQERLLLYVANHNDQIFVLNWIERI